jgi:hypothetical protein
MGERDKKLDAWLAEQTSKPEATSIEDRLEAADPPSKQCVFFFKTVHEQKIARDDVGVHAGLVPPLRCLA